MILLTVDPFGVLSTCTINPLEHRVVLISSPADSYNAYQFDEIRIKVFSIWSTKTGGKIPPLIVNMVNFNWGL